MDTTTATLTVGDIVTYLGRPYSIGNVLGSAVVLRNDQTADAIGGVMTVPASMVKAA